MPERKRTPRTKRPTENEKPKVEILPFEEPEPSSAQENMAKLVSEIGNVFVSAVKEDAAGKAERARIQLPLQQDQLKLQEKQVANYHEAQMEAQQQFFKKHTRAFWFNALMAGLIMVFMMSTGAFLLYTGDKTNGMAIIGLLIGLIGGFLGGAGWQKSRTQSDDQQSQ
jgi:hypothetical protein